MYKYWIIILPLNIHKITECDYWILKQPLNIRAGKTGDVNLDAFGDRDPFFWITDMAANGTFVKIAELVHLENGKRVI